MLSKSITFLALGAAATVSAGSLRTDVRCPQDTPVQCRDGSCHTTQEYCSRHHERVRLLGYDDGHDDPAAHQDPSTYAEHHPPATATEGHFCACPGACLPNGDWTAPAANNCPMVAGVCDTWMTTSADCHTLPHIVHHDDTTHNCPAATPFQCHDGSCHITQMDCDTYGGQHHYVATPPVTPPVTPPGTSYHGPTFFRKGCAGPQCTQIPDTIPCARKNAQTKCASVNGHTIKAGCRCAKKNFQSRADTVSMCVAGVNRCGNPTVKCSDHVGGSTIDFSRQGVGTCDKACNPTDPDRRAWVGGRLTTFEECQHQCSLIGFDWNIVNSVTVTDAGESNTADTAAYSTFFLFVFFVFFFISTFSSLHRC